MTEVSNNAMSGVVALIYGLVMLAYSTALPYLVRLILGPQALFYIQGGFTGLFIIFIFFFIKETSHLTDKQKKTLYSPTAEKNRRSLANTLETGY